jgi:tetratricopeptide (TPR) repeat protein
MYKKEFLEKIIKINTLLDKEKEITEATYEKIKLYLNEIKELGKFSPNSWKKEWRKEIYNFGEHFKEVNPEKVFGLINEIIESTKELSKIEVLEFIKSEVFVNFFTDEESIEYLKSLILKFKLNPEFKNSLAIQYSILGKDDLYCKFLKQALKLDKKNEEWLDLIYRTEYFIGEKLISEKKHEEAENFIQDIIDSNFYKDYRSNEYQNFFIFLKQRNDDQLLIENKLSEINKSSKKLIEELFDKSRIKVIEILAFFIAIIAFIFGAVSISIKLELSSALVLMSSFGFAMIIFSLTMSLVFIKSEVPLLKDKRLWALIIILLINISIIFLSPIMVNLIEALT